MGLDLRLDDNCAVEKLPLAGWTANRRSCVPLALGDDADTVMLIERAYCPIERGDPIAQVASQAKQIESRFESQWSRARLSGPSATTDRGLSAVCQVRLSEPYPVVHRPVGMNDLQVHLRPFCADDVDLLHEAVAESIAEIAPWMAWCHAEYGRDDSAAWVASRDADWSNGVEYSFVIEDAGGTLLGGCGLNRIDVPNQCANIGYWVRTSATGRGVATAATRQLCAIAFDEFDLHRLEIMASVDNRASQRVAEKIGAVREGILRRRLLVRGERQDVVLYSIIEQPPPENLRPGQS